MLYTRHKKRTTFIRVFPVILNLPACDARTPPSYDLVELFLGVLLSRLYYVSSHRHWQFPRADVDARVYAYTSVAALFAWEEPEFLLVFHISLDVCEWHVSSLTPFIYITAYFIVVVVIIIIIIIIAFITLCYFACKCARTSHILFIMLWLRTFCHFFIVDVIAQWCRHNKLFIMTRAKTKIIKVASEKSVNVNRDWPKLLYTVSDSRTYQLHT